jgi:hypothetical protein
VTAATAAGQDVTVPDIADPVVPDRTPTGLIRARPRLRLLHYEPDPEESGSPPPAPAPARTRPEAVAEDTPDTLILRRRAEHVLRLTFEVLDGRRPVAQLAGHLEPRALRYVRAALPRTPVRLPARMTSLHVDRPSADALEVAAVYRRGPRARVLAARFERIAVAGATAGPAPCAQRDRVPGPDPREWRCVVLRLL